MKIAAATLAVLVTLTTGAVVKAFVVIHSTCSPPLVSPSFTKASLLAAKRQSDEHQEQEADPFDLGPKRKKSNRNKARKAKQKAALAMKEARKSAEVTTGTTGVERVTTGTVTTTKEEPIKTLGGGPSLVFAMARRILVWEGRELNDKSTAAPAPSSSGRHRRPVLPRWHPHAGISDNNPAFRQSSPKMNNQGYAGVIRRNSRKPRKPSLWRHALRMYDRMRTLEEQEAPPPLSPKIKRSVVHHEAALVACAKLGLWREALQIFREVENSKRKQQQQRLKSATATTYNSTTSAHRRRNVRVTENMVLSLVNACVRASKKLVKDGAGVEERREPLDVARDILLTIEEQHDIPLVARHLNPLAAAYQSLGLTQEAFEILNTKLDERTTTISEKKDGEHEILFSFNDLGAKDQASYSLLVKGAVSEGDWAGAVDGLRNMTGAGFYPNSRNLNSWTEVSKSERRSSSRNSWKKKRDEYWLESIR